jgi:hypothetical protein
MLLVPYESLSVEVAAPIEAVRERIYHALHPKSGQALYDGVLYRDSFTMSKAIRYRDSLLPVIQGRLVATEVGTRVDVRLRPHLATLAVLVVGLLLFLFMICTFLIHIITEAANIGGACVALVMALGWYTIFTAWFRLEVPSTRKGLQAVLTGTLAAPYSPDTPVENTSRPPWVGGAPDSRR